MIEKFSIRRIPTNRYPTECYMHPVATITYTALQIPIEVSKNITEYKALVKCRFEEKISKGVWKWRKQYTRLVSHEYVEIRYVNDKSEKLISVKRVG